MKRMFIFNMFNYKIYERFAAKILRDDYNYKCEQDIDCKSDVFFKKFSDEELEDFISKYDLIFINNGYRLQQKKITDIIKRLKKNTIFTELGHLPQARSIHLDYKGLYHESSISLDLDWITEQQIIDTKLKLQKSHYFNFLSNQQNNYILCVLQMDFDSSLIGSKMKNIDLIKYCLNKYSNEKIIFKFHPRHTYHDKEKIFNIFKSEKLSFEDRIPFLFLAKNSKKIVGMSSTCLIEGLAINKEVEAIAECPIYNHQKNNTFDKDKILTAYFLHQYEYTDYKDAKRCLDLVMKRSKYLI